MAIKNKLTVIGTVSTVPQHFTNLPTQPDETTFSVDVQSTIKSESGKTQSIPVTFNCVCWGETSEVAQILVEKGRGIALSGQVYNRNGKTCIQVEEFIMLAEYK
jgi:single-stranded DNA-binding protein